MSKIRLDRLQDKTTLGVQVKPFLPSESFESKARALGAHRDDHYIFLLLEAGSGSLMVDLQDVNMGAPQLFYILPGQVHYHIRTRKARGWFLAVDRSLVPQGCRNVFEGRLTLQVPCTLPPVALQECVQLLMLLEKRAAAGHPAGSPGRPASGPAGSSASGPAGSSASGPADSSASGPAGSSAFGPAASPSKLGTSVIHALVQSFLWLAADVYDDTVTTNKVLSRPAELCRQFRLLLSENFRFLKSPSAYASRLHISTAYLNEAIRGETGLPCSHWIQQEILMEAKRLLYHSELSIKEIALELGYEDPAYFSRFFRRTAGMPPLAFRATNRH